MSRIFLCLVRFNPCEIHTMKPVSVPFRSFAARASAFAGLSFAFCEDDAKKTDRRMIRPRDLPLYGSPESDGYLKFIS